MRLTLRTLLAYLDRILDAEDALELEQKIQQSEIASQLVQRIKKSHKHRSAKVIAVDAEGIGTDANHVAEYLDNTLPAEQVPDFERDCLESDDQLAEVASCHQILTLVLGEPAEVPASLKKRIYGLRSATTGAGATTDGQTSDGVRIRVDESAAASARGRPVIDSDERWTEAPEYLKRPRRRWVPVVLTSLIAFCLAMAALRGMGPLDASHPLAVRFGLSSVPEEELLPDSPNADVASVESSTPRAPTDSQNESVPDRYEEIAREDSSKPNDDVPAVLESGADEPSVQPPDDSALVDAEMDSAEAVGGDAQLPELPGDRRADVSDDLEPIDLASDSAVDQSGPLRDDSFESDTDVSRDFESALGQADPSSDSAELADLVADDQRIDAVSAESGTTADTTDRVSPPLPPTLINPLADNEAGSSKGREPAEAIPALPATNGESLATGDLANVGQSTSAESSGADLQAEEPRPVIRDVGRFLDERQVLISYNASQDQWQRVPSGSKLQADKTLMTLPTYRVPLSLASGVQLTLIGATRGMLLPITDAEETPVMRLDYGRILVATFSQAGRAFGLRWGNQQSARIRLTDMETTLAIELRPHHLPGADPSKHAAYQVLHVYLLSGNAEWTTPGGAPITLTDGQRLTQVNGGDARQSDVDEMPPWITGKDAKPRDPMAAGDLADKLVGDRPVTLVLREQADRDRLETRSLAVCSLVQFDEFDPLIVALNDTDLRSYWASEFDALVAAPSRSRETALALQRSLEAKHGAETGQQMYALLAGFLPEQLAAGGAESLVQLLDHPSCDMRVIASESLKRISGRPSLYRAHANERRRRTAVVRWKRHLENGEIVYAELPEILRLLNDVPNDSQ